MTQINSWRDNGKRHALIAAVLFFISACVHGGEESNKVIQVSGPQLLASSAALDDFKKKGYSLENYRVLIGEHPHGFEIVFVPNHPAGTPVVRGGGTSYGKEIRYTVSQEGVIEEIGYAR